MFAASETAIPSRKADHTAPHARRVGNAVGFGTLTVAKSKSPSTDSGHSEALTVSAPLCSANSRW